MIADDDPTAQRLREAVWADPHADAPRMVFADYFLQAGDPLGELVALQLQRARTGEAMSQRELALVVAHGRRNFQPISTGIQRHAMERGFLAEATPIGTIMAPELAEHPAWSTMRRLTLHASAHHPLWNNSQLHALETLCTTDDVLLELSRRTEPLPITGLTGAYAHQGIAVAPDTVAALSHHGAFDRVRRASLAAWQFERALDTERPALESRLITQLEHLDLTFASVRLDDLGMWRRWIASTAIARFSVQLPLGYRDPPRDTDESVWSGGPTHFAYFELERDQLVIQLDEATGTVHVDNALAVATELAGDRTRVVIEDLHDAPNAADRHAALIAALGARFADVIVTTGPTRPLAP